MLHHRQIGGGITLWAGQRIRVELAADAGAGLSGNLLHQARVADVLDKQCRRFLLADLTNQLRHLRRRRFGIGAQPLW